MISFRYVPSWTELFRWNLSIPWNFWPLWKWSMLTVRAGLSSNPRNDPAAPLRWIATSLSVWSPTLRVHLTYLRGSRRSESASAFSTVIWNTGTLPAILKNSADGSGLSAAPADAATSRTVQQPRRMRIPPGWSLPG